MILWFLETNRSHIALECLLNYACSDNGHARHCAFHVLCITWKEFFRSVTINNARFIFPGTCCEAVPTIGAASSDKRCQRWFIVFNWTGHAYGWLCKLQCRCPHYSSERRNQQLQLFYGAISMTQLDNLVVNTYCSFLSLSIIFLF